MGAHNTKVPQKGHKICKINVLNHTPGKLHGMGVVGVMDLVKDCGICALTVRYILVGRMKVVAFLVLLG